MFSCKSFSQELIQGKLLLEDFTTIKLSVYNKNSNETIDTDSRGIFQMKMSVNDTLVFFQNEIIFDEFIVPETVLSTKSLRYFLKKDGTTLNELVIDRGPVFNFGTKPKTKVEKLEHQNSIKKVENNSIGITLDGVVNRITGRNKLIKKIISYEEEQNDFDAFKAVYSDDMLIKQFIIPKEQINIFRYFFIADPEFDRSHISLEESYQFFLNSVVLKFKKEYELKVPILFLLYSLHKLHQKYQKHPEQTVFE